MSIDRCSRCDNLIDTDDDPDCYVEKPTYTSVANPAAPAFKERVEYVCICGPCREKLEEEIPNMSMKFAIPEEKHKEFREDIIALLRKYGSKLAAHEMLAIAAHVVGQLIALQDQNTMTSEMAIKLVLKNMEHGNLDAIKQLDNSGGRA